MTLSGCSSSSPPQYVANPGVPSPRGPSAGGTPQTAGARVGDLLLTGGYIPQPASPSVAAAYFTVTNSGSKPDVLQRVRTDVTSSVMAMTETDSGASGSMTALPKVVVPAHGVFRFAEGHAHLMLRNPDKKLRQGDTVRMTITFAHAGTVRLVLPVDGFLGPSTAPSSSSPMSDMSMAGTATR